MLWQKVLPSAVSSLSALSLPASHHNLPTKLYVPSPTFYSTTPTSQIRSSFIPSPPQSFLHHHPAVQGIEARALHHLHLHGHPPPVARRKIGRRLKEELPTWRTKSLVELHFKVSQEIFSKPSIHVTSLPRIYVALSSHTNCTCESEALIPIYQFVLFSDNPPTITS